MVKIVESLTIFHLISISIPIEEKIVWKLYKICILRAFCFTIRLTCVFLTVILSYYIVLVLVKSICVWLKSDDSWMEDIWITFTFCLFLSLHTRIKWHQIKSRNEWIISCQIIVFLIQNCNSPFDTTDFLFYQRQKHGYLLLLHTL